MERDDSFHKSLFAILLTESVVTYCLVTTKAFFYFWIEYFQHAVEPYFYQLCSSFFPVLFGGTLFVSKAMWNRKSKLHAKNETFIICCFELCEYFHQLNHCSTAHFQH